MSAEHLEVEAHRFDGGLDAVASKAASSTLYARK
jgi:hypothetical protein